MLIELSKRYSAIQILAIILLAAGLWIAPFIDPCSWSLPQHVSPLSRVIIAGFGAQCVLMTGIGFMLLILQAFYLNHILIKHNILPVRTTLAILIYILLMSQSYRAVTLNQVLLASIFVLPSLDLILLSSREQKPIFNIFLASAMMAIASLFCFPLVFFIPALFIAVFIFNLRPRLQALILSLGGVLLVYFCYGLHISLSDNLHDTLYAYYMWFINPPLFWHYIAPGTFLLVAWQIFLFAAVARRLLFNLKKLEINHRNRLVFGLYFVILSVLSVLYYINEFGLGLLPLAIPLTMFLSGYLVLSTQKKWVWVQEMILFSWYLGLFVQNIYLYKY